MTLATCAELPAGDEDGPRLLAALDRLGVPARFVAWDAADAAWAGTLVVLRSTWDYTQRLDEFRHWIDQVPRVANPAPVVQWNTDKVYLQQLGRAGVPTVPTAFAAPGAAVELPGGGDVVVKPSVGAGSRGAGRFTMDVAGGAAAAREHAATLHAAGRTVLVQPYVASVDVAGETALIYLDGTFSHAIRKGPMLAGGVVHPVAGRALYVEELITARQPSGAQLEVGEQVLDFVRRRFGGDLLYARVDLLEAADGPVVVELELTEPSLFLGFAPAAADMFAAAIGRRL